MALNNSTRTISRRSWLQTAAGAAAVSLSPILAHAKSTGAGLAFGLVTYQWGAAWDLPQLIAMCEQSGVLGVELRTTHAHGVEPALDAAARAAVRQRFADSPATLVGLGSDERFDNPDPAVVAKAVEASKAFLQLSHDVGGTGVKVKPDRFHPGVPREKTIEQIGRSLNELGAFAQNLGQQVRLEIHGQCAELPTIAQIMAIADHPHVALCWNSNPQDLLGDGLAHNLGLVIRRFGATCHVHELESTTYPYAELFRLLVAADYQGWLLLEAGSKPSDPLSALKDQAARFRQLVEQARAASV